MGKGKGKGKYIKSVREQYEQYPYPNRNPEDESKRLMQTTMDGLGQINHFGFGGRQTFNGFRALVAGGGTGDGVIYLAEQLRDYDAEVVYLDMSTASLEIARKRARKRNLTNIKWVNDSLLSLPDLELGRFDYINCSGVLHHLDSPPDGLAALKAVLADNGVMGIMLYATYGRNTTYMIQELMRHFNAGQNNLKTQVDNTKRALNILPPAHPFNLKSHVGSDHIVGGDAGVYDLFLHSQDRSYTVPEVYEFIAQGGLKFVGFCGSTRPLYEPVNHVTDPVLLDILSGMDEPQQQAVVELVRGTTSQHTFYVSNAAPNVADPKDMDNVPFYNGLPKDQRPQLAARMERKGGGSFFISSPLGVQAYFHPREGSYAPRFLMQIDGVKTMAELFDAVRADLTTAPTDKELMEDFLPLYRNLNDPEWLLLRHRDIEPFTSADALHAQLKTHLKK